MKKIIVFLAVIIGFAVNVKASHIVGGEISWRCLPSGQYIFSVSIFRDCTGIQFSLPSIPLGIYGSPLPRNGAGGSVITSINLTFDQQRFITSNNGDSSPDCTSNGGQSRKSCANGDQGVIQEFYYNSNPITLTGTPPSQGWTFYWDAPCCRPSDFDNINLNGNALLRAIMYAGPNGQSAGPCFDSSPVFKSLPTTMVCRGYEFTYNHIAIDEDLDSIVYAWDRPYNQPVSNPQPLPYKLGFSATSFTPGQNFNINNIAATLDPLTGVTRMALYSGVGPAKYLAVVRVDAYRNSTRIASIFRELPFSIFDCPDLPGSPGLKNNPPDVLIDGVVTSSTITTVTAGQTVSIPMQAIDNDRINVAPFSQILTMVPDGLLFTRSKTGPSKKYSLDPVGEPCEITNKDVHPCAFLRGNPAPYIDQTATPPKTVVKGLGVIGVEFVWQTDCKHIQTKTGFPGTNEGIYNFVLRVSDDHCAIPAINYPTVTVRVRDPIPLTEPIVKGVSVLLDGTTLYNWVPPLDSARQFNPPDRRNDHFESASSKPQTNSPPSFWTSLNGFITKYKQDKRSIDFSPYNLNNVFDPNSGYNILVPNGSHLSQSFDYYVRMRSLSGCTDTNASIWSEPARIMEVTSTPVGPGGLNPPRSIARLDWNRPKPLNAKSYPYFTYESPTHFYVYANDSISNGGAGINSNWYIVGETNATTYNVDATSCSNYVGFRIEARDTVITWKEGASLRSDSLDTLYFSTFSTIDTMFMEAGSFIPDPTFDMVEVRADGTVFLRINLQGKRTTGSYKIFQNDTTSANLLASVNALEDSIVVLSGGDLAFKNIVIQAFDACKPFNKTYFSTYQTILPTGFLSDTCRGEYTLNWNQPTSVLGSAPGILNNTAKYKVYANYGNGNGYVLVATIANRNTTTAVIGGISRGITVKYRVEATDSKGKVNISAIHEYTADSTLATNELVYPPTLRCTYVNADGSVKLSWIPAVDSVNNFARYNIQYKKASESVWSEIPADADDLIAISEESYTVRGLVVQKINAQLEKYDFRITSMAGCKGDSFIVYNEISSILLAGSALLNGQQNYSELTWNLAGPDYGPLGFPSIVSSSNAQPFTFEKSALNPGAQDLDVELGEGVCELPISYRIDHIDSLFEAATGFRCELRSSIALTVHIDTTRPEPENIAMLTFNRQDKELVAHWIGDAAGADSLSFFTRDGFNSGFPILIPLTDNAIWIDKPGRSEQFPLSIIDARDTVQVVGAFAKDECNNNTLGEIVYHKSMDVDVDWKICDSTNVISWTQYIGLNPNFEVEYEVFFNTDGGTNWTAAPNSVTTDSTYNHFVRTGGLTYYYYVKAKSLDPNAPIWMQPGSNVDSSFSVYEDTPLYYYLTYATVIPSNQVELEYYRDTLTPVKGYTVFRGDTPSEMLPQAYFDANDLEGKDRFTFLDKTADVNAQEYYYQVVSQNDCDILTSRSNMGRTIHLVVESDDEGLTNTLKWNRYLDWDSTVAYYNVYRTTRDIYSRTVYKQVAPNSAYDYNVFVDEITDEVNSTGKYYYRVEAVQGAFDGDAAINGYPSDLTSQISNSNIAEALQDPLMYVPNAFAPDGINRRFGPKGQFYKFDQFEMTIYNRWGEQIYVTKDINKGWDGTVEGVDASTGSYVYMIRYVDGDGNEKRKKGTVTLIR